jgi:thymidine kinase
MVERLTAEGNDEHLVKAGQNTTGWVEVIAGSMFSGKSEELIRRLRRARIARLKVQVFKPEIDVRFSRDHIVSHSEMRHESCAVRSAREILELLDPATEVVGIDEAQFFDLELVELVSELADRGLRVIVAGLDLDYLRRPFGPMPQLLALAEYVDKMHAVCMRCGEPACYSQRTAGGSEQLQVGDTESYEARCRGCFEPFEPVRS